MNKYLQKRKEPKPGHTSHTRILHLTNHKSFAMTSSFLISSHLSRTSTLDPTLQPASRHLSGCLVITSQLPTWAFQCMRHYSLQSSKKASSGLEFDIPLLATSLEIQMNFNGLYFLLFATCFIQQHNSLLSTSAAQCSPHPSPPDSTCKAMGFKACPECKTGAMKTDKIAADSKGVCCCWCCCCCCCCCRRRGGGGGMVVICLLIFWRMIDCKEGHVKRNFFVAKEKQNSCFTNSF